MDRATLSRRERKLSNESIASFLETYPHAKIAIEAQMSAIPIYRQLTKNGYDVFVSHPTKTKLIAESRIKTDRIDSHALAELLRLDALPESYMSDEVTSDLKEMVRRRAFLVRERSKFKAKIRDCLVYRGIKEPKDYGLFTNAGITWLESLNLEPIDAYLRIISSLNLETKKLSEKLKSLAADDEDVKLLTTIPGIGYYSALLIKSEIGEIGRFPSGEKLCSYAGLVPSVRSSGNRAVYGPITKQGSRWLRWIMVEAAHAHAKHDTTISRFYHSLAERKGKQIAAVATARKLLLCCYSVLKNRRAYYDQAS